MPAHQGLPLTGYISHISASQSHKCYQKLECGPIRTRKYMSRHYNLNTQARRSGLPEVFMSQIFSISATKMQHVKTFSIRVFGLTNFELRVSNYKLTVHEFFR